jgi:formate C-acetyltransferase
MTATARLAQAKDATAPAWQGFRTGLWQKEINVRDFIQQNYQPYHGNASFLAPATSRAQSIWGA